MSEPNVIRIRVNIRKGSWGLRCQFIDADSSSYYNASDLKEAFTLDSRIEIENESYDHSKHRGKLSKSHVENSIAKMIGGYKITDSESRLAVRQRIGWYSSGRVPHSIEKRRELNYI